MSTEVAHPAPSHQLAAVAPGGASLSTWLTPSSFEAAEKIAALMAKCGTLPKHLVDKPADCFRIVVQAAKWGMDPFAVGEHTSLVHGRLCYEGKLVHAVLLATGAIDEPLNFDFTGEGNALTVTVSGKLKKSGLVKTIVGTVAQWATDSGHWKKDPHSALCYRGARQWARIYQPGALLGVVTPDEAEEIKTVQAEVVPEATPAKAREVEAEVQKPNAAATQAEANKLADAKAQPLFTVLELQKRANDVHREFGKAGLAKIKEFCDRLSIKQIADCPPEKAAEAMEIFKTFERELHEGGQTTTGGVK